MARASRPRSSWLTGNTPLIVWDGQTGKELRRFETRARCVAFSPDGELAAAGLMRGGSWSGRSPPVRLWPCSRSVPIGSMHWPSAAIPAQPQRHRSPLGPPPLAACRRRFGVRRSPSGTSDRRSPRAVDLSRQLPRDLRARFLTRRVPARLRRSRGRESLGPRHRPAAPGHQHRQLPVRPGFLP